MLEEEGQIVGYAMVIGESLKRSRHKGSLVMGILQKHQGKGGGSKLLTIFDWGKKSPLHRIELTVIHTTQEQLHSKKIRIYN